MSNTVAASGGQPDNIAYKLIAATVIAIVLPTLALVMRLVARKIMRVRLYWDDWLMIIAWVFKIGLDISGSLLIEHGMGRHINTVSPNDLVVFLQVQYTGVVQYPLCVTFTKLSILYQYRRLFPNRDFRLMINVLISIMIMWCTAVVFTGIFLCTPISKSWYPLEPGTCIDLVPFYYGMQIPNVVTDLLILLLPFREIQKLDLPLRQKLGVAVTCALWLISLVFGVVRLAVMIELTNLGADVTYNLVNAAIWTTIEPAVQISTACLPSIRVLYRTARDRGLKHSVSQRLHSLSLTSSRPRDTDNDTLTTYAATHDGSQTTGTNDHMSRQPVKGDIYV